MYAERILNKLSWTIAVPKVFGTRAIVCSSFDRCLKGSLAMGPEKGEVGNLDRSSQS
jgi:hypothetical protein